MFDDGYWNGRETEDRIVIARNSLISTFLAADKSVICDDTNLPSKVVKDLIVIGKKNKASIEIRDLTDTDVELCVSRDWGRFPTTSVGEVVIRDMHKRFIKGRSWPLGVPVVDEIVPEVSDYYNDPELPAAFIVDLDGTVALMGDRPGWGYPAEAVANDEPNEAVLRLVHAIWHQGYKVVFVSGRKDYCREATREWLANYVGLRAERSELYMRADNDNRKDYIVKADIFDKHIAGRFYIAGVFDDRNQVVKMWRERYGFTVFQVAEGDF